MSSVRRPFANTRCNSTVRYSSDGSLSSLLSHSKTLRPGIGWIAPAPAISSAFRPTLIQPNPRAAYKAASHVSLAGINQLSTSFPATFQLLRQHGGEDDAGHGQL